MTTFNLTGPLPSGTVLLEASAGTGKTYTLASLAVRYLAEGAATLSDLLLITFSRMATAELRARVRSRLAEAMDALGEGAGTSKGDEMLALLCNVDTVERQERLARLRTAAADLDAATIATTHEFCQRMLLGLGVLADHDHSPQFVTDPTALVAQATADTYLRSFRAQRAGFPYSSTWGEKVPATRFGGQVVREPAATVVPEDATGVAQARVDFAVAVRDEVEHRKRRQRLFTYDDQLSRLRDALIDPITGQLARARLTSRFTTVLVDEFQDTDPIQWEILSLTFHGHSTLVLIGDPKQAIYGFRGADIGTYQRAATMADQVLALTTNHRTDAVLVQALDQLLAGAELGEGIAVPPVTAAQHSRRVTAPDARHTRPLRIRGVPPTGRELSRTKANQTIIDDVVRQVADLLAADIVVSLGDSSRPLRPHDIAILVRTNRIGQQIARALRGVGQAAAVTGSDSLFSPRGPQTTPVTSWVTLLTALVDPRGQHVRNAAITPFLGWTAQDLANADDADLAALRETVHEWSNLWHTHGLAAVWEAIIAQPTFAARIRAHFDGDRTLADLRQLAIECQRAVHAGVPAASLATWLTDQMLEQPDVHRYLASDAEAVQILTIHRSKGLEFPFVLLPDLALRRPWTARGDETVVFHDQQHRRCVDVGGRSAPGRESRLARHRAEADAEALRDLYVAMTRAQLGVIAWWVPEGSTGESPLHRVLARPSNVRSPAPRYPLDALEIRSDRRLVTFEAFSPDELAQPAASRSLERPAVAPVRTWNRVIDTLWRRTSYSGITAAAHHAVPHTLVRTDEPSELQGGDDGRSLTTEIRRSADAPVSPFLGFPRGAELGNLVHAAFEEVDFSAADLDQELLTVATRACSRSSLSVTASQLASAMKPVLHTPLGALTKGRDLTSFTRTDRLNELSFDLPMADRDSATLKDIAALVEAHLGTDDPLAGYPARLRELDPDNLPLAGVLTGSIDAVLRIRDVNKYLVVDYKTNQLGGPEQYLSNYTPDALAQAMMDSHYPLQALLYSVALHRFLRWRVADYDPTIHLGGVGYLFVRGMGGQSAPGQTGVFSWTPAPELVVGVSHALAGVQRVGGTR